MHRGTLEAINECRLCILDARRFQDIVGHFHHPHFNPKTYATKFVKLLNAYDGELSDLSTGGEFEAMLALIPKKPPQSKAKSVLISLQESVLARRNLSLMQASSFNDIGPIEGKFTKTNVVEVQ
mmetsp:Transcript_143707/g.264051  ORF Transcript_143707/g.264051 Transcript_143707/m.264051 type:complete len:124 (+) Transcript_143707:2-373(+)